MNSIEKVVLFTFFECSYRIDAWWTSFARSKLWIISVLINSAKMPSKNYFNFCSHQQCLGWSFPTQPCQYQVLPSFLPLLWFSPLNCLVTPFAILNLGSFPFLTSWKEFTIYHRYFSFICWVNYWMDWSLRLADMGQRWRSGGFWVFQGIRLKREKSRSWFSPSFGGLGGQWFCHLLYFFHYTWATRLEDKMKKVS